MLNRVEAVIRCYDPCLSCASHAFGQMPLLVELPTPPAASSTGSSDADASGTRIVSSQRRCGRALGCGAGVAHAGHRLRQPDPRRRRHRSAGGRALAAGPLPAGRARACRATCSPPNWPRTWPRSTASSSSTPTVAGPSGRGAGAHARAGRPRDVDDGALSRPARAARLVRDAVPARAAGLAGVGRRRSRSTMQATASARPPQRQCRRCWPRCAD